MDRELTWIIAKHLSNSNKRATVVILLGVMALAFYSNMAMEFNRTTRKHSNI